MLVLVFSAQTLTKKIGSNIGYELRYIIRFVKINDDTLIYRTKKR